MIRLVINIYFQEDRTKAFTPVTGSHPMVALKPLVTDTGKSVRPTMTEIRNVQPQPGLPTVVMSLNADVNLSL